MLPKLFSIFGVIVVKTSEYKRHLKEWNELCTHFGFLQKDNLLQEAELNALEAELEALRPQRDKKGRFIKREKTIKAD